MPRTRDHFGVVPEADVFASLIPAALPTTSRIVNRLKHHRRIAMRYDRRAENYLRFVLLAVARLVV